MRLIDADALIAEWYKLNNIGPEDCGARFVGYQEIARLINNAPTVSGQGDYISRADAIDAVCKAVCEDDVSIFPECGQIKYCDEIQALLALPSADAVSREMYDDVVQTIIKREKQFTNMVSVVRCKDCRHRDLFSCPLADNDFQKDNDYCSWGERSEPSK